MKTKIWLIVFLTLATLQYIHSADTYQPPVLIRKGILPSSSAGGSFTVASEAEVDAGVNNTNGITPARFTYGLQNLIAGSGGVSVSNSGAGILIGSDGSLLEVTAGTATPTVCTSTSDYYIETDAPVGQQVYGCPDGANFVPIFRGRRILKPATINASASTPNSATYVDVTGGTYTATESFTAGDILWHDIHYTKPATNTVAMECQLHQAGTAISGGAFSFTAAHTNGILQIKEIITGASSQITNNTGIASSGGSYTIAPAIAAVSNTTPAFSFKCKNAGGADADDVITIVSYQVSIDDVF
jgi:hypothetical protein